MKTLQLYISPIQMQQAHWVTMTRQQPQLLLLQQPLLAKHSFPMVHRILCCRWSCSSLLG